MGLQGVFKGSSPQGVFIWSSKGFQEVFKHYKSKEFRVIQLEPKILRLVQVYLGICDFHSIFIGYTFDINFMHKNRIYPVDKLIGTVSIQ